MKKFSFILVCLFASTVIYAQEPVNILQSINMSAESGSALIGLNFNGPVSFTSMKLTDPFRIVLDFTDCRKGGSVKNSIKVNSDGIKEISVSQMGSNDAPTLRVTIVTAVDLEFNIEPTDNGINVRISGVKLASAEETSSKSTAEPANVVEVTPRQQEEVKPEPAPAPVVAEAKPEPKPEPAPAPVVAEAKPEPKPEPAPAPVVAEAKPEPKPEPAPAPVVAEAKPEPQPEPAPAPVVAEAKPEPKPEPAPAPVVAEAKPEPKPEPAPAPVVAEAKPEPQPEPAPVREEKKQKFKLPPAMAAANDSSEPAPKQEKKPKFKEAPAKAASNETTSQVDHFTPPPRKKSSSGRNSLTWLGFQMSATGSRIFIKTSDEAEYSIKEKDDKTLVLELYNTDIPKKNNRRALDTSFFNSPVSYISPQIESGSIKVVKIEIKLKQRVPFITKQESNALYVDFEGAN